MRRASVVAASRAWPGGARSLTSPYWWAIVAAEDARFGFPEVTRGIVPSEGGLIRLPRDLPYHIATRVLLTGEPLRAADVAGQRELKASAQRPAFDGGDQRFFDRGPGLPAEPAAGQHRQLAAHERLQVHAGAEGAAGAGDDADGQSGILVQRVQSGGELLGYLMVDGVHLRGAVDRHRQDSVLTLSEDNPGCTGGRAHGALPSCDAAAGGMTPTERKSAMS